MKITMKKLHIHQQGTREKGLEYLEKKVLRERPESVKGFL